MDLTLTEEQEFFRKTLADTVDRLILPKTRELDEATEFPWSLWKEFGSLGYLGLRYPEEIGGMNAGPLMFAIFGEEITRGSVGFAMSCLQNILMGTDFIFRFGSAGLKERCLYPAMRGEKVATVCFTEDQSGSDLAATKTLALKDGKGWRINGTKMWITNGPVCDFCTVLATTDRSKGFKALNFFLVEKGTPGFLPGQILHKLGCGSSVTGEVVFDNVWVPDENLLGEEVNKGATYLQAVLSEVRVLTAAQALGIARGAYDEALEFARKRVAFGQPIGTFQLIREKLARMDTLITASRLMIYNCVCLMERGLDARVKAAETKVFAAEACLEVVDQLMRIYGANAYAREYSPQRFLRDAYFALYGGGTHEILKDFIGKSLVGKV